MKTLLILFGKLMVKILKLLGKNAGNLPGCVLWTLTKHRCVSLFMSTALLSPLLVQTEKHPSPTMWHNSLKKQGQISSPTTAETI